MSDLAAALAKLQTKLPHILKDNAAVIQPKDGGPTYGYKYADLASVSKAILPLLGELGVAFICKPTLNEDGKFVLAYALAMGDEEMGGFYPLPTGTPQQVGSAITYARRYCLCAVTGAVADEDDDGAAAERADGLPVNADGSLSRSRTSDEQKTAAGVMTDAEQRAHNQLAKPSPNTGPVVRIGALRTSDAGLVPCDDPTCNKTLHTHHRVPVDAAVDDRWTSDAPSWAVGVDPPEDQPGSIADAQRKQIHAVYSAMKIGSADRHADAAKVFGADVNSFNDLSYQQAARLLENLHERHSGKMTRR